MILETPSLSISGLIELLKAFPELLKFGAIGLGAILAALAFFLLWWEQQQTKPRTAILNGIRFFMVFACVLTLIGVFAPPMSIKSLSNVVPPEEKKLVEKLPVETKDAYSIIKEVSVFDLRSWQPIPPGMENEKVSPVNFFNYLHVKKIADVDTVFAHYSTKGADIDLRCISHNYVSYQENSTSHDGERNYGIAIDISNQKVGDEFLILVEATYWNGFKDLPKEAAYTYTDDDISQLQELSLIVLLPGKQRRERISRSTSWA